MNPPRIKTPPKVHSHQNTDIPNDLSPEEAVLWIQNVSPDTRIPQLEKIIATDLYWSYYYALSVIKGPFELAEPIIARNARYACLYALHVLGKRWLEAEDIMMSDDYNWNIYCSKFPVLLSMSDDEEIAK